MWDALRTPGAVVVLRHSYAPGAFDPPTARLEDCSTQRNLDANGRAQAQRTGEAFRQHGIEVGAVLSSPRCRCLDTARLAFGRWRRGRRSGARSTTPSSGAGRSRRSGVGSPGIASGPPLVLVTHGSVVTDLTGLSVQMGAFVVLRRAADGSHTVAGQLYVD